jgi:CPA2 family monovalent cation:H+ antiporter-2
VVARAVVEHARKVSREIDIVARASSVEQLPLFRDWDITEVVIPEFEAGLKMTRQALMTSECRSRRSSGDPRLPVRRSSAPCIHLQRVESPLSGVAIGDAQIRTRTGAAVVGVLRQGRLKANPDAKFRFAPGDAVAVMGTEEARQRFRQAVA